VIGNIGAVFEFEWRRALSSTRRIWWLTLAAFPIFIIAIVRFTVSQQAFAQELPPELRSTMESREAETRIEIWRQLCAWLMFALIPMLVSMLGTLLWTAPAISSELERRSWVYLAVRPNGGSAVLLGKYLAAVTWVIPAAIVGLSIAVPLSASGDSWRIWYTMFALVLLSCPAYAAIFLTVGVMWPRRAMVMSVAYTLLFEMVMSFVPAVINKITIQYRLRALAANWCSLGIPGVEESGVMMLIGNESAWTHIIILLGITLGLLTVSIVKLRTTEFSTSSESDT
jgi:ABC-type transport system involved in multi-copper enzyme maturation permease subunit